MKSLLISICLLAVSTLNLAQSGNIGIGTNTPTAKLDVNGTFKANGTSILDDSIYVTGPAYLQNSLSVLTGATISNGLTVNGFTQLNDYLSLAGGLTVSGLATMNNSLTVIGGLQTYGNVSATGGTLIGNGLNVNGAGTIIQLSVPAGITSSNGLFTGLVDAGTLVADEISTNGQLSSGSLQTGEIFAGPTQISSLQVTGNSNFNTLGATNGTIGSNLTVGSNLTANGSVLNGLGLVFPNIVFNRRINLWGSGNDHQFIGFGNTSNTLRYQVSSLNDNHIFYAGIDNSSSQELMRIHGSGNVGIGCTTSSNRLDVSIGGRYGDHPAGLPLYITADCGASAGGFEIRHLNGTQGIGFGYNTIYAAGSWIDQDLGLKTNGVGDVIFINDETETMRLLDDGNLNLLGNINNEPFIAPALQNGFYNYGGGFATAAYFKDKMGIVHLRGLVYIGVDPDNLVIFNLPVGYRPSTSGQLIFSGLNNDVTCRIDVSSNGNVVVSSGSTGWINLSEISFRAD